MSNEIVIALITGTITLITSLGSSILVFIVNNKKVKADQDKAQEDRLAKQNEKIEKMQNEIQSTLAEHKKEYLDKINTLHNSISDIKSEYKQSQIAIELKIEALSDRVEKHNNVIERTYKVETDVEVIKEQIKGLQN